MRSIIEFFTLRNKSSSKSSKAGLPKHKKEKPLFWLVLLISLPAVISLIKPGFYSMYDDMQVIRLQQMDMCIKDGQIPCRWVPELGYGYGYPLFQYYAPLPYYTMEAFHLVGFSYIDSVKIGFGLSVFLSAIFMYFLSKQFFSKIPSLVAATLYIFLPFRAADLYVRGGMGQLWGMVALPLFLLGLELLIRKRGNKQIAFFAVTTAIFLLSHNLTVFMSIPLLLAWFLVRIVMEKTKRLEVVKSVAAGSVVGLLAASFFIVPLIVERSQVHLETLTQGYFNYLAHFINLKQLFVSLLWGYGPTVLGPGDDVFLGLGPIHFLFAVLGFLVVFSKAKKQTKKLAVALFIVLMGSLFLAHERSSFIWNLIPQLSYVQFPWRFVLIAGFCASFLGAFWFSTINKKITPILYIVSLIVILAFYGGFFAPKDWFYITDEQKLSGENYQRQITASIYDYLPKSASENPDDQAPTTVISGEGEIVVDSFEKGTNWYKVSLQVLSESAQVVFPSYDFPGWKIWANDNEIKTERYSELGLVSARLQKGNYNIIVKLTNSPSRTIGNLLSLVGLVIVSVLLFSKKKYV
jgi:hypothetical protein